jgi:hypothetical protein
MVVEMRAQRGSAKRHVERRYAKTAGLEIFHGIYSFHVQWHCFYENPRKALGCH